MTGKTIYEDRVYTIYDDRGESAACDKVPLDGSFGNALPIGIEFHPVTNSFKFPDGTRIKNHEFPQGVPINITDLPTKVGFSGRKRALFDFYFVMGLFFVSDKFRAAVESLEPGKHQFAPAEVVWKTDGSHAANHFWFNPCARIDAMDREYTTFVLPEGAAHWNRAGGGKFVINLDRIGKNHIWIEPRVVAFNYPFISDTLKKALEDAGTKGIGYRAIPAV